MNSIRRFSKWARPRYWYVTDYVQQNNMTIASHLPNNDSPRHLCKLVKCVCSYHYVCSLEIKFSHNTFPGSSTKSKAKLGVLHTCQDSRILP